MEKPLNDTQVDKLHEAISWSIKQLNTPRKNRVAAIKRFVGKHYAANGSDVIMPVNMEKMAVDIYVRYLAARNPRGMFTAKHPSLISTAKSFELAVNQIPDEIGLNKTLREVVTESLLSPMGIVKCGLHTVGTLMNQPYGETFVDCVTLDHYFCDLSARTWDQVQFEGNDYWMEFEDFEEWVDPADRKDVKADPYEILGEHGDTQAGSITADSTAAVFRERIWLRDVWLPKERVMLTYGVKSKKIFKTVEYDVDAPAPYIPLWYTRVPGNLLALPPVAGWEDLNVLANAVFRKLGSSADAYKEVLVFAGGDDAGVNAFKAARHGDGINVASMKEPAKWTVGGPEPRSIVLYDKIRELQSYFANNLGSLGGLAPQSSTIGQDKLLQQAASAQVNDMADQMADFIRKIFKALAYYEWTNPVKTRTVKKDIAGQTIDVEWDNDAKQGGKFSDFDIDIDVYSLPDESPSTQLQKLGLFVQQYVLPFSPMIQQMGGYIDVESIIKKASTLANLKDATTFVTFPDDPLPQSQSGSGSTNQYLGVPQPLQGGQPEEVPQQGMDQGMMSKLMSME